MIAAALASAALFAAQASAQAFTPLINQRWPWPYSGPEQVDTSDGERGLMTGYNRCNASTEGPTSLCVNAVINDITDFCIYALPTLDIIANGEGESVAYCSKPGYGTRLLTAGAITGMQVVRTPGYLAIAGYLDQTTVDIQAGDSGGELDPHGADNRGNPIGSLMYSKVFSSNSTPVQVIEWHEFIGSGLFCMKICDPAIPPNSPGSPQGNFCENSHDTIGCDGNVPLNYAAINGTFSYCQGDNQQVPNGQPLPIPATSSCTTYASTQIFTALATPTAASSSSAAQSTSTAAPASASAASAFAKSASTSSSKSAAMAAGVHADTTLVGAALVSFAAVVGAAAVLL